MFRYQLPNIHGTDECETVTFDSPIDAGLEINEMRLISELPEALRQAVLLSLQAIGEESAEMADWLVRVK